MPTPSPTDSAAARLKERAREELLLRPFAASWWLRGGRRQTLLSAKLPRREPPRLSLERWTTRDDDFLRVHLREGDPAKPLVVVLHGLEGSVESSYVGWMARLVEPLGWGTVVPEHRSCGGEMNRTLRGYHSGVTDDLAFVVDELVARFPGRRIYLFGVSLGGNMLLKWLGERGDDLPAEVIAGATVSPPFDLEASATNADTAIGGAMARVFLKTLIPKALEKARRFPGVLDEAAVRRARTFREFDDVVTAPLHGFRDARDYWRSQSSRRFLGGVRRPALVIASRDDPLNPGETIPESELERSPYLVPMLTRRGGHAAFLTGGAPWSAARWAEERVVRYFQLCESS